MSGISLLCELIKCDKGIPHALGTLSAREADRLACCRQGRALAVELSPCWLLCPAVPGVGLEMQGSLLVSFSSPPNLQVASRNKGGVGMEWGLGVFSVLLLRLGHVYTLAISMQSNQPEFAPVSICRAFASHGVWQLLHLMSSLAWFPSWPLSPGLLPTGEVMFNRSRRW